VEFLVALGVASLVFTAVGMLTIYTAQSFVALGNYSDLERYSRNALDQMSRDIRQTRSVAFYSTNKLIFEDYDGQTNLTYTWNSANSQLTRQKGTLTTILLTNCDYLVFGKYQRNPSNNFSFFPAANISQIKLIDVSWRCSRKIRGAKLNTESVQTAKIVIRN
jgi:hypothetical protein